MPRSETSFGQKLIKYGPKLLLIPLAYEIGRWAFPLAIRRQKIKETAGQCEGCGEQVGEDMIIGHIVHGRDAEHSVLSNAKGFCLACEAENHLKHAENPEKIGLRQQDNDSVIIGRLSELRKQNRRRYQEVVQKYRKKIQTVEARIAAGRLLSKHSVPETGGLRNK